LLGLAASYPLSGVALIAGIAASEKAWWAYPVLLGFYALMFGVLRRLALEAPAGRRLFGWALGLVGVHAFLALLFCGRILHSGDFLITALLLLVCPIMVLVGLGCGQMAQSLEKPLLALGARLTALLWLPLTLILGTLPFLVFFAFQCVLVLILAGCLKAIPEQEEGLGFNRFT